MFERFFSPSPAEQDKEGENYGYFVHGLGFELKIPNISRTYIEKNGKDANFDALRRYFQQFVGEIHGPGGYEHPWPWRPLYVPHV